MFARKLQALGYPNRNCFNAQDKTDLRELIIWLEQLKIRQYKPDDRNFLLNTPLPQWLEVYAAYLRDAECPFKEEELTECVDWLLGYAIRLEYSDNVPQFSENSAENVEQRQMDIRDNSFDSFDYESAEFKECVAKLADLLGIQQHPTDVRVTFRALAKYAEKYISTNVKPLNSETQKRQTPLANVDLGFDLNDTAANHAAKVLRLLFIKDVRDLQTRINEAIVSVQKITANPKTDTALGKVGR